MSIVSDMLIGGEWLPGSSRLPVHDPSDGSVISEIAVASEIECEAAVTAAADAQPSWAATAPRQRGEILRRAFELMTAEAEYLAELISKENGKVLADARGEVTYAAEFFRWFSEEAVRTPGDYREAPNGDKRILVTHYPIGPSLLITPWNFPAAMATRKLGPALAAGCTTILKPATETALTALAIVDILQRAGVPAGVVNVILPQPVGENINRILHDPRIRSLSFTGSTAVGSILLRQGADRVIRCSMELGGNAPFLVLSDADVDAAVTGAMLAKMRNGGAACTAANRFFVARNVEAEFTEKFASAMGKLRLGPGVHPDTDLGPSCRTTSATRSPTSSPMPLLPARRLLSVAPRRRDSERSTLRRSSRVSPKTPRFSIAKSSAQSPQSLRSIQMTRRLSWRTIPISASLATSTPATWAER